MTIHFEPVDEPTETEQKLDRYEEALHRIAKWAEAYPLQVFPAMTEEYAKRAHEVLVAHGMSIDRISADAMRHVIEGAGKIAKEALKEDKDHADQL